MVKIILLLSSFVALSTAHFEYQCSFLNTTYFPTGNYYYTCVVNNVRIFNTSVPVFAKENVGHQNNTKIETWDPNGNHKMSTFSDEDVNRLKFNSAKMPDIPRSIFQKFEQLEVLEVIGCGLRNIFQNSLTGAMDLKILMAYENKLTSLFAYSFVNSPHLEHLDLSSNKIGHIHSLAFSDLEELKELSLGHNNINIIEDKTFKPLVSLNRIWLNNNKMEILSLDLFASNLKLEGIYLSNNKLTAISSFLFDQLPVLKFLYLADNPCVHKIFNSSFIAHNVNVKKELASCYKEYKSIIPDEKHELKLRKVLNEVGAAKMSCETDRNTLRQSLEKAKDEFNVLEYKLG
ncbi:unnamed protein product [Diamesa serratosioi]